MSGSGSSSSTPETHDDARLPPPTATSRTHIHANTPQPTTPPHRRLSPGGWRLYKPVEATTKSYPTRGATPGSPPQDMNDETWVHSLDDPRRGPSLGHGLRDKIGGSIHPLTAPPRSQTRFRSRGSRRRGPIHRTRCGKRRPAPDPATVGSPPPHLHPASDNKASCWLRPPAAASVSTGPTDKRVAKTQ